MEELTMPETCTFCNHGGPGLPPHSCPECGGVYGHAQLGGARCLHCNRKVIALVPEIQNWLDQNEPPAMPPENP